MTEGAKELPSTDASNWDAHFEAQFETIGQRLSGIAGALGPYRERLDQLARDGLAAQRVESSGWLPHYTTPFHLVGSAEVDLTTVSAVLTAHYRDRWQEVRAAFEARASDYDLDDEAKATFAEALGTHEHGFYRATCRLLFPEIERVARAELHLVPGAPATSQRELRKRAGHLALAATEPAGFSALHLHKRLRNHLYSPTKEVSVAELLADPVPNRHAVLHGLVPYSTMQNSINMLIMADFVFQVICALKESV